MKITGKLIDIYYREIYPAVISIDNNVIAKIETAVTAPDVYILPGLIDAHIHIESSMITPGAFASEAVRHGTTGVISDPHEIANILGIEGIILMIDNAKKAHVRFWFGAPSCVPATNFETNGETIDFEKIKVLLDMNEIKYMSEIMNFPGVIFDDPVIWNKIAYSKKKGKPIDGHAPCLTGEKLKKYISAGISTDHECSAIEEAREKISLGMKILIREGSAARNLNALKDLFRTNPEMLMLCSDDLHPEMLKKGHINKLLSRLIYDGYNIFDVIRSASVNPVSHYNLEAGLLQPGQSADFIIVEDYRKMNILETWIKGSKVFDRGKVLFDYEKAKTINKFICSELNCDEIKIIRHSEKMQVIEAFDGELLTKNLIKKCRGKELVEADTENDILKIVIKDRYRDAPPSTGFVKGFGLKMGAFASSVAHDSHNIVCVGENDCDIISAINEIVRMKGGLAVSSGGKIRSLQLNIAGIISDKPCDEIATAYEKLTKLVKSLGCNMKSPFMTLSFMALLVIPELKISDRGLFNVNKFELVPLFID